MLRDKALRKDDTIIGNKTPSHETPAGWPRELAINLVGLATLAAVIAIAGHALRLDAAPTATSVRAYAAANGLDYVESEHRYEYARVLSGGGSGGDAIIRSVAAQQK